MKKLNAILSVAMFFAASTTLAASGTIETKQATNRDNTIDITIEDAAAQAISNQLSLNGVKMERDGFSGTLVQSGQGIRCIAENGDRALYCYIALVGASVQ